MTRYLTEEEVIAIHERVCSDFARTSDPVGMGGTRDDGRLLSSVVARQHVGFGGELKYADPLANAATLTFGICCGHPFHNGNKRTALVSMLAHLDRNNLTLFGVKQAHLYSMIKSVAEHQFGIRKDPRKKRRVYSPREVDEEVRAIARWLEKYARPFRRGERLITYKQLRRVLATHGLDLAHPKNNAIGVYREVQVKTLFKTRTEQVHVTTIPYPGDSKVVGFSTIKRIRRNCGLDEQNGCDAKAFYEGSDVIDVFVNEYRGILSRLARE